MKYQILEFQNSGFFKNKFSVLKATKTLSIMNFLQELTITPINSKTHYYAFFNDSSLGENLLTPLKNYFENIIVEL
jgi:hypothetical protein